MKVILLNDIPKIGRKGDIKDVASGYATNYLLPRGLVEVATGKKIQELEERKKESVVEQKIQENLLEKNIQALKGVVVEISAKANEKGHLYESVHILEILHALKKQEHVDLNEESLSLDGPIKEIGEQTISVKEGNFVGSFVVSVKAQ